MINIEEAIKFPLLIDGGHSTVMEEMGCDLDHELWSAKLLDSDPESIIKAHELYIEAGAKCLATASYQGTVDGFMKLGYTKTQAKELLLKSVDLVAIAINNMMQQAIIKVRPLIAASIGPYGAYLADGSEYHGNYDVSDEILIAFHKERIELFEDSDADILAFETFPNLQEAKVVAQLMENSTKQAWISFSCKDETHIHDGTPIAEVAKLFSKHAAIFAIGVNCTAPKHISGLIRAIKSTCGAKKILVYPNSGEAYNVASKSWMGVSDPVLFVNMAKEWIQEGADIIGGCCRIGPDHIKRMNHFLEKG